MLHSYILKETIDEGIILFNSIYSRIEAIGGILERNIGRIEITFYMFIIGFMTLTIITMFLGKGT